MGLTRWLSDILGLSRQSPFRSKPEAGAHFRPNLECVEDR
jgi:hypothetical protein